MFQVLRDVCAGAGGGGRYRLLYIERGTDGEVGTHYYIYRRRRREGSVHIIIYIGRDGGMGGGKMKRAPCGGDVAWRPCHEACPGVGGGGGGEAGGGHSCPAVGRSEKRLRRRT